MTTEKTIPTEYRWKDAEQVPCGACGCTCVIVRRTFDNKEVDQYACDNCGYYWWEDNATFD